MPQGGLTLSDTTLYGTTRDGGFNSAGTVFKLSLDGTSFQTLHDFTSFSGGYQPYGSIVVSGSKLFGITAFGGTNNSGSLYSMNLDGSGFQVVQSFGGSTNGDLPLGGLVAAGSTIYGTTPSGGINGRGTIFSISTSGSSFQILHAFSGLADGSDCRTALTVSGSKLYGVTNQGGANNLSAIFSLNLDGSGFQRAYSFSGSGNVLPNDLIVSGSSIFGTTYGGGPTGDGYVFSLDTTGANFQALHAFSGTDGSRPYGGLALGGSVLYGTTNSTSTIFSVNTDGSGFNTIARMNGFPSPRGPVGDPLITGGVLYGVTDSDGTSGNGTVFKLTGVVPEPSSALLLCVGIALLTNRRKRRTLP